MYCDCVGLAITAAEQRSRREKFKKTKHLIPSAYMQTLLLSWYFLRFISYGYCFFHYGSAFSALILLASRFHFWHRNKYHVGEITVPAVIRRLTPPSQLAIQLSNKMLKTPLYHAVLLSARTSAVLCFLVD